MADTPTTDIFDEAPTTPAPPATPPTTPQAAPPPTQTQPKSGDMFDESDDTSLADRVKKWVNTPIFDLATGGAVSRQMAQENDIGQQIINHEIASAHPWRAAMAQAFYGSIKDARQFGMELTTPAQVATMAGSAVSRLFKIGANLYFTAKGGQAMMDDWAAAKDFAENAAAGKFQGDPEGLQRFLFGAAGFTMGATGTAEGGKQLSNKLRGRVQDKLGISGDLADQVASKVQDAHEIRQKGVDRANAVAAQGQAQALGIRGQSAQTQLTAATQLADVQQQIPIAVSQIMRDALPVVLEEQARVGKPFNDMKAMTDDPVTDAVSLRAAIINTLGEHGIHEHEIPAKIFNAIADRGIGSSEQNEMQEWERNIDPQVLARLRAQGVTEGFDKTGEKPVDFGALLRVKQDIFEAASKATDMKLRRGLTDALDTVTNMQEDFAVKHNFGNTNKTVTIDGQPTVINEMLRSANLAYTKFMRELGSKDMQDFTKAENLRQQMMINALAKFKGVATGPVLRQILNIAGVDVKPLDDLLTQEASAKATLKEGGKGAESQAREVISETQKRSAGIRQQTISAVNELGKKSPIIQGKSDYQLLGKTTEAIRRDALNALAENAKQKGIGSPYSLALMGLGIVRFLTGGFVSGGFLFVRGKAMGGGANAAAARILRNPTFQDWAIKEAGVHPTNSTLIGKLRKAFNAVATSGSLAKAAIDMAQKPDQQGQQ